jgi:hypothetical protein
MLSAVGKKTGAFLSRSAASMIKGSASVLPSSAEEEEENTFALVPEVYDKHIPESIPLTKCARQNLS